MGFFNKLLGAAAITGAAVGGAMYIKKRKDETSSNTEFEDFDDEKIFDVDKGLDENGNQKITITFNSKKAKHVADNAADKVIDAADKAKATFSEKLGDENVEYIKDKAQDAKDKFNDAASFAKAKAQDAKDIIVDKVGEENIQAAKEKVQDAANTAKEKITETVDKIIKPADNNASEDFSEDDFVNEDDFEEDFLDEELDDI